jgi:hypothetical protein
MRLTDRIPTPKAVEILMKSILDSEKSIEHRIEDATYLTVIQSRIDKVLNNFQQEYEEYVNHMMEKEEEK